MVGEAKFASSLAIFGGVFALVLDQKLYCTVE